MFKGTIPPELQAIVHEHARGWKATNVYVGCSGNFTIERGLADLPVDVHGNDVQLYSCALGWALTKQPFRLDIKEQHRAEYGWLLDWCKSPVDSAATIMLCSTMLDGWKSPSAYYARIRGEYHRTWAGLHAKTVSKFEDLPIRLVDFFAGDVREHFRRAPADAALVSFPPFDVGGYETMFAGIHEVFDWDEPAYGLIEKDDIDEIIGQMREHDEWMVGLHIERDHLAPFLRGRVQTSNRQRPIHVYGSGPKRRIATVHQKIESPTVTHLKPGEEITGPLTLAPLTGPQFAALRSLYMNHHIRPAAVGASWAVLDAGRLVGCFAVAGDAPGTFSKRMPAMPTAYLLSDFPVAGTSYPRMSKLVLYAALSKEAHRLIERALNRRVRSLVTTAFTNNPVSMKYRGVFDLLDRKRSDHEEGAEWMLNYGSVAARWSLADGLGEWQYKHGKKIGVAYE